MNIDSIRFGSIIIALLIANCDNVSYSGYRIYRLFPGDERQVNLVNIFADNLNAFAVPLPIRFLRRTSTHDGYFDVLVPPDRLTEFNNLMDVYGIRRTTKVDDVQKKIEQQTNMVKAVPPNQANDAQVFFQSFPTVERIYSFIESLQQKYPNLLISKSGGRSTEGRPLPQMKIGSSATAKPIIFIQGGIHAREWIAVTTTLYVAWQILVDYNDDANLRKFEWHVWPLMNPDGYVYSYKTDRYWRKSRSKQTHGCIGIDLNRQFDVHFSNKSHPCDETYGGQKPVTEPEVVAMTNHIVKYKRRIKMYIDFHSYSQIWFTPYGWTKDLPADYGTQKGMGNVATKAISSVNGTHYKVGPSSRILYINCGAADDWIYQLGIVFSHSVELPIDDFVISSDHIKPIGRETYAGVKAATSHLRAYLKEQVKF